MTENICPLMSRMVLTIGNKGHLLLAKCQGEKCGLWHICLPERERVRG